MADNGPPGIMEIVERQQQRDCQMHPHDSSCGVCIQWAVEAGWRAALDRLRYLESQGIHVDLVPGGNVAGGIGG